MLVFLEVPRHHTTLLTTLKPWLLSVHDKQIVKVVHTLHEHGIELNSAMSMAVKVRSVDRWLIVGNFRVALL